MEFKRLDNIRKSNDTKILSLLQLVYSACNLTVPQGTADLVKTKLFRSLWRNKKDKIKRSGLYQDPDRGGIRMTDTNIMFKALKLAWIPRLIKSVNSNCMVHHSEPFF